MQYNSSQSNLVKIFLSILLLSLYTSIYIAQTDTWSYKSNMPTARTFLGGCVLEGKFYAIGGDEDYTPSSAVEVYDPITDSWQILANMPSALCYPQVCTFSSKIFVFGGAQGVYQPRRNVVYEYDPTIDTWTQKDDMPQKAGCSGISLLNDIIYLFGTQTSHDSPPDTRVIAYDIINEVWTEKANMITPRSNASACVVNGKIYVIGGSTENWRDVFYKHVEVYDPTTDEWTAKADMPTGRWGLTTVVINGLIYAIGGRSGGFSTPANEVYDPAANTWTTMSPMNEARSAPVGGVIDNKIYVVGGHNSPDYNVSRVLEVYSPMIVSIDDEDVYSSQARIYQLYNNYPNPFNPSTIIKYSIPKQTNVTLKVFDALGSEVATLIDKENPQGKYEIEFDPSADGVGLSSGIYFYRLRTGDFVETKKMILLK
ncbi:MAG: kelch repeat-containing protein [Melioribacteraceae bacterium]|nr:kelch repeat-containing protein [Melioribacteraceae bacterium]